MTIRLPSKAHSSRRPLIGHARPNHWCWECRKQKPREQFRAPIREGDVCRECLSERDEMARAKRNDERKARRRRAKARARAALESRAAKEGSDGR